MPLRSLFAANIVTLYQISVRRPSSCWVHHCWVHISTRCLKRGGRSCFCCQRDYNSCQTTTVFILRNVLTAPRLMHLLRSTLCIDSPVLPLYDAVLRESLSATINIDLDDIRLSQESVPIKWGCSGRPWCCFASTVCLFGLSRNVFQLDILQLHSP